jgi:hypothetical protein
MKLYLGKYAKMTNLESYTMNSLYELWNVYKEYLKGNKFKDIDYPEFDLKLT